MSTERTRRRAQAAESPIRILVSNGQSLLCDAVKLALEREIDLEVVAEAEDASAVVAAAENIQPDIVLLDANMPDCAIRTIDFVRKRAPACRVLLLAEDENGEMLTDGMEAGASGFLSKDRPVSELIAAVRSIHCGETFVAQSMIGTLVSELIRRRKDREEALRRTARLTPREREILAHLAKGLGASAIAEALVISRNTARTHIQNVLGKLGVHSRLEAATLIMDHDILEALVEGTR